MVKPSGTVQLSPSAFKISCYPYLLCDRGLLESQDLLRHTGLPLRLDLYQVAWSCLFSPTSRASRGGAGSATHLASVMLLPKGADVKLLRFDTVSRVALCMPKNSLLLCRSLCTQKASRLDGDPWLKESLGRRIGRTIWHEVFATRANLTALCLPC